MCRAREFARTVARNRGERTRCDDARGVERTWCRIGGNHQRTLETRPSRVRGRVQRLSQLPRHRGAHRIRAAMSVDVVAEMFGEFQSQDRAKTPVDRSQAVNRCYYCRSPCCTIIWVLCACARPVVKACPDGSRERMNIKEKSTDQESGMETVVLLRAIHCIADWSNFICVYFHTALRPNRSNWP